MHARRYELALSPEEASAALEAALLTRDVHSAEDDIHVDVVARAGQVELRGQSQSSFTARIEVALEATSGGCTFSLRRVPPRLHAVAEFGSLVAVGLLSAGFVAMVSPWVALGVLAVDLLLVGTLWLFERRKIAAINDTLVSLVWSAWAPALQDRSPGMYRGLPA